MQPRAGGRDFWGRDEEEQRAALTSLLVRAYELITGRGWSPSLDVPEAHRKPRPEATLSVLEALAAASPGGVTGDIDVHRARKVLERVEWPVWQWERHPLRTQTDVFELLRKGINLSGGDAPPLPRERHTPKRGGWSITNGPRGRGVA